MLTAKSKDLMLAALDILHYCIRRQK